VELFEARGVSFVSVTQQFNTTTSMGRLTLNVLLSFAQFEWEVAGERIRDKFAASRRKGMWMGGTVPLGYRVKDRKLVVDAAEADIGCVNEFHVIFQNHKVPTDEQLLRTYTSQPSVYSREKSSNLGLSPNRATIRSRTSY